MSLIAEAQTWGTMVHLLGTGDHVSYRDWQAAMLRIQRRKNSSRMELRQDRPWQIICMGEGMKMRGLFRQQRSTKHSGVQDSQTGEGDLVEAGDCLLEKEGEQWDTQSEEFSLTNRDN